jgi:hypothetical protein
MKEELTKIWKTTEKESNRNPGNKKLFKANEKIQGKATPAK